jgi:electron transfer flavoprotein alpha/beta subunit
VHVVSMGPPPAGNIVKECLALGADHGVLLSDHAFGGADAFATAFTLAKAIQKIGDVDLVICGMASSDGATEWVGPQIAVFLGFAVVTMVNAIDQATGNCWLVQAAWEEGVRKVELSLPAVLTVARELNEPKALSFSGIIKARKKEITVWDSAVLGTDPEQVGMQGSPTIVSSFGTMETGRDVEFLQGTPEEKAEELVSRLAESGALA